MLDENDKLIGNPYHYRDTRTEGMYDEAFKLVPKEEIFKETGIAFNWFNTIYQLLSAKLSGDTSLKNAKTLLMMPDLFNFFLTGVKKTEYTNASTTQMYNSEKYEWSYDLLKKLGIPTDILTDVIFPGEIVGKVNRNLQKNLVLNKCLLLRLLHTIREVPLLQYRLLTKKTLFTYLRVHGHLWVLNLTSLILRTVHSTITLQTRAELIRQSVS